MTLIIALTLSASPAEAAVVKQPTAAEVGPWGAIKAWWASVGPWPV